MNGLLFGSTGKVGKAWLRLSAGRPDDLHLSPMGGSADFDLCTTKGLEAALQVIERKRPALVVLAAAWTDVDRCEREPELAMRINAQSVERIATTCVQVQAGLIFYSSDYVFDGSGPKGEEDPTAPLNVYGCSKEAAEQAVISCGVEHLIVRINVPLARAADGTNFYSFVAGKLKGGEVVRIVTDQWNNPLDTGRIVNWSWEAWRQGTRGILHLGGGTYAARFDIARLIAEHLQIDDTRVQPIRTADLHQAAPRPNRGGLLIARQSQLFGTAPDLPTILKMLSG